MNIRTKTATLFCFATLFGMNSAFAAVPAGAVKATSDVSLEQYFSAPTEGVSKPDNDGFIRRWLLLEPISKPNGSNTVFTDSYIKKNLGETEYFKDQFTTDLKKLPKDGGKVTVMIPEPQAGGQGGFRMMAPQQPQAEQKLIKKTLKWHALESTRFNVKLFRFATNLTTDKYGLVFWAVTVINCEEDMENVRLAVGSNSASMWWLNGEEALLLSGDRRMVMDDVVSGRLTLKKGKNILRGAVINGPGMSDFCLRFLDENGEPVKNITVSYK